MKPDREGENDSNTKWRRSEWRTGAADGERVRVVNHYDDAARPKDLQSEWLKLTKQGLTETGHGRIKFTQCSASAELQPTPATALLTFSNHLRWIFSHGNKSNSVGNFHNKHTWLQHFYPNLKVCFSNIHCLFMSFLISYVDHWCYWNTWTQKNKL